MNFIIFHSEKNFIISGVCLSGVCISGVCHGTGNDYKSRNSSLFLARENSSLRLFLTLPKLPTSPNYPYLASKELAKDTQEIKKIKKYKKSMLTDLDLRFSLEYN